jgi:hypothetical protein
MPAQRRCICSNAASPPVGVGLWRMSLGQEQARTLENSDQRDYLFVACVAATTFGIFRRWTLRETNFSLCLEFVSPLSTLILVSYMTL